ncbi:MAG TPA: LysR family transcriptional regulator [Steroidobacteraceae bacterium]
MSDLDLNLLHVLVAIDQHHSVSAAAVALRRSQPSVSVALRKLRDYFEDPLFVRTGNVMQPTPRAASLIRSSQSVLARVDLDIVAASAFDPLTSRSVVTFALSDVGEVVVLPAIMKELRRQMPQAPIRSLSLPANQVATELEGGGVDLAIGYFPDLKARNFYQQALYFDTFACLIRAQHPIKADTLSIKQYLQLEHVVVRAESRTEEVIERYLTRNRIRRNVVLTTPHFASAPMIVAQSDLVVTIPQPLAQYFSRVGANVRVVGLPFDPPSIALKQFWHRKYHRDARNKWLRNLVCRLFQAHSEDWASARKVE